MTLPLRQCTPMSYYKRKPTRIPEYDYSHNNYYFVTMCTHNKECIFGKPNCVNWLGRIAEDDMNGIAEHFSTVRVDKFVVMPNHVHAIIVIDNGNDTEKKVSLVNIIGQYKSGVTRKIRTLLDNKQVWQRSFHDRIIRNQKEYEKIWMYIETNPQRWNEDCFYIVEA